MPPQPFTRLSPAVPDVVSARLLLQAQLGYDAAVLARRSGVTNAALAHDHRLWEQAAAAIVTLAAHLGDLCAASAFSDAGPTVSMLAARFSEALDDQIDAHAWAVIDAAVALRAQGLP